jgi:hypothetical protein
VRSPRTLDVLGRVGARRRRLGAQRGDLLGRAPAQIGERLEDLRGQGQAEVALARAEALRQGAHLRVQRVEGVALAHRVGKGIRPPEVIGSTLGRHAVAHDDGCTVSSSIRVRTA